MQEDIIDQEAGEASSPYERAPVLLQVLPAMEAGGVERGTADIARAAAEHGWISLVASEGGRMEADLMRGGAEHIAMPLKAKSPLAIRANAARLARLIRERGVDIVHARSRAPAWSALLAARRTNTAFVTTYHSAYGEANIFKRLYNSVMIRGDRIIATSNFLKSVMEERYNFDRSKLRLIPRGVDLKRFNASAVSAERLIKLANDWRLPDGVPVIMLPGRLTRLKGQHVLLKALAQMQDMEFIALIVGNDKGRGAFRQELEHMATDLGLASKVRLLESCSDMPCAYMLADVVVSASIEPEGFGRIAVEAQAMGRPVIATGHGGSRETVLPGKTGWLVAPNDPGTMARTLREALSLDANARATMAMAARRHVEEKFSLERMCNSTLLVYEELLRRR